MSTWGFKLDEIAVPVLVLHGVRDMFVPSSHAAWVAQTIPASTLRLEAGGHFSTIPRSEDALAWLFTPRHQPRQRA